MSMEAFGIEKEFLQSLLKESESGKDQLPEFQRGWAWPMENIRSLLASISLGYPVGTVMMLRTGGDVRFKHRPVEGVTTNGTAERLILDGQQRLTSLFQALLLGRPIDTQDARKRKLSGWFYLDIDKALNAQIDREEAFVFVPADRRVKNFRGEVEVDVSTAEGEYAAGLFPLALAFDSADWFDAYDAHWGYDRERLQRRTEFRQQVLDQFKTYQIPVIELMSSTPRAAVCQVFEKVNTGGVTLTVFELLTATYAADGFDLRNDWDERQKTWAGPEYAVLREVSNTDFLQAVTLLATREARESYLAAHSEDERAPRIGCRRADILNLPLDAYRRWAPQVSAGFRQAAKLLHQQYVFDTRFLPYGSQLIPLSAILTVLDGQATTVDAQQKLTRWLWCGVFGELYGGTTETRFARDLPDVVAWVRGAAAEPRTVEEAQFVPGRLDTLRSRNSAAYKGLYAMLMKNGALDWRSGEPASVTNYFDEAVDIHHIFPRAWCEKKSISPAVYNSILNKTPLTARTNRVIGGHAPSSYVKSLTVSSGSDVEVVRTNIESHLVDVEPLLADDFETFMAARRVALLDLVGTAMGKTLASAGTEDSVAEPAESPEDLQDV